MAVAGSFVPQCRSLVSPQHQLIPSSRRTGAGAAAQLSLKPRSHAFLGEKGIRVQRFQSRKGWRKRAPPTILTVRATSSSGPFVNEESWGGGDGGGLTAQRQKEQVVKEKKKKKREIAGVDQSQLLDPHLLADPDSRFAEYYGIQIHHKVARPARHGAVSDASSASAVNNEVDEEEKRVNVPAILLHGFGASLFSWERVMPKFSELLGAPVLAFDRPAFGLTSRTFPSGSSTAEGTKPKSRNVYSVAFSAAAALAFVDFLHSDQAILIGHSAGCLVAVEAYFQSPEKIAALVLVAPALVAPLVMEQIANSEKSRTKESEYEGKIKKDKTNPFTKVWAALLWIWVKFTSFLSMVRRFMLLVLSKVLAVLFRSPPAVWLVRKIMDKGGPWAVRYAFYDVLKADKYVLDGYTKPLQCRDWEKALLEYCLALIDNTEEQASGKKKLQDVACPVLVMTGDTDRLVPGWNSERLVKVFPHAEFKLIKNCGHLPQEETPDEFVNTIKYWLVCTLGKKTNSIEPAMG